MVDKVCRFKKNQYLFLHTGICGVRRLWQCRDTRPGERAYPGCGLAVDSLTAMLHWASEYSRKRKCTKGHDATRIRQKARKTKKATLKNIATRQV